MTFPNFCIVHRQKMWLPLIDNQSTYYRSSYQLKSDISTSKYLLYLVTCFVFTSSLDDYLKYNQLDVSLNNLMLARSCIHYRPSNPQKITSQYPWWLVETCKNKMSKSPMSSFLILNDWLINPKIWSLNHMSQPSTTLHNWLSHNHFLLSLSLICHSTIGCQQ